MSHFEGAKKSATEPSESIAASRLGTLAGKLKSVRRGTLVSTAVLVFATEFRQSTGILLDKELRKTKSGAALLGSSIVSGFMIGSSLTSIGSQIGSLYAAKPVDVIYGDLIFVAGIGIQAIIHFVKRRLKQNA